MKFFTVLSVFISPVLLGGCATSYSPPPAENSARLRIGVPQSETFASVRILSYPSGQCESPMSLGLVGGMGKWKDEKSIGIPGHETFAPSTSIERLVPAGAPYMISMRGFYSGNVCMITLNVNLDKGGDYEAIYSWGGGKCFIDLKRVNRSDSGQVLRSMVPNIEQTSVCTKGFN